MSSGRSTARDESVARLTNLTFALQGAAAAGGSPDRSGEWIRTHVEGYDAGSREAFDKRLHRDIRTLRRAGVPIIQTGKDANGSSLYRLQASEYRLPPLHFSPQEAMVLAVAAGLSPSGGLSDYSRAGWTKIAASGALRDVSGAPTYVATNDITRGDPEVVRAVVTAVRKKLRITFLYTARPGATPVKRVMDPWGVVCHNSRIYLVGWDADREDTRVFRLLRVADVRRSPQPATHPEPPAALQELVRDALDRDELVDATVAITRPPHGGHGDGGAVAAEFIHHPRAKVDLGADDGEVDGEITVFLPRVPLGWVVRTAAGYADVAEVVSPASAREQVIEVLQAAAQHTAAAEGGQVRDEQ